MIRIASCQGYNGWLLIDEESTKSILFQVDYDYPSLARLMGWQPCNACGIDFKHWCKGGCDTDGTISCAHGFPPSMFIESAIEFLEKCDGGLVLDQETASEYFKEDEVMEISLALDGAGIVQLKNSDIVEFKSEKGVVARVFFENKGLQICFTDLEGFKKVELDTNQDLEIIVRKERR